MRQVWRTTGRRALVHAMTLVVVRQQALCVKARVVERSVGASVTFPTPLTHTVGLTHLPKDLFSPFSEEGAGSMCAQVLPCLQKPDVVVLWMVFTHCVLRLLRQRLCRLRLPIAAPFVLGVHSG